MSGPKHSEWSVLENARLEAVRCEALRGDIERLRERIGCAAERAKADWPDAAARWAARAASAGSPTANGGSVRLAQIVAVLQPLASQAEAEISSLEAATRLAGELRELSANARARDSNASALAAQREEAQRKERQTLAQELLSRLPALSEQERSAAEALAKRLVTCAPAQARMVELELRAELQLQQRRAAVRALEQAEAVALRGRLCGFAGPEVERLKDRLAAVDAGRLRLDETLRVDVERAAQNLAAEADRIYAAEVLRREFQALGYEVGGEFETAFAKGGTAQIARAQPGEYSVELRVDPSLSVLDVELVRVAEDHGVSAAERSLRDTFAEQEWCRDLARAFAGAEAQHVQARVRSRIAPGTAPVRASASAADGRKRRAARAAAAALPVNR